MVAERACWSQEAGRIVEAHAVSRWNYLFLGGVAVLGIADCRA
jgi:hypothetical protein